MSEHSPVSNLTTEQCWELLHAQEFGRLAFHLLDEVHIEVRGAGVSGSLAHWR